ncbi:MAG: dmpD [Chloroflexi bacterium]|nr:dmpD [Chloroflexota bacterium]
MLSKPELSLSDMNKATGDFFYNSQHQRVPEVSAMRLEDLRRPGVQERERAAAFRQIQGGRQNNAASDLATIAAPTCLIHGRDERYFFAAAEAPILIEAAVKMSFVVPNANCFLLAQCGHWPQIEKSDMFNALSLEFLKQAGR